MIQKTNYQEWFLLYVDKELNASQRMEVEDFLQMHPELQSELDELLSTVLVSDINQTSSWKHLEKQEIADEWKEKILDAVDGELLPDEADGVENYLKTNTSAAQLYKELATTKLITEETSFPDKSTLLRKEKDVKIFPLWLKYALSSAAILSALLVGYHFYKGSESRITENKILAHTITNDGNIKNHTAPDVQQKKDNVVVKDNDNETLASSKTRVEDKSTVHSDIKKKNKVQTSVRETAIVTTHTKLPPLIRPNENVASVIVSDKKWQETPNNTKSIAVNEKIENVSFAVASVSHHAPMVLKSGKRIITASQQEEDESIRVASTNIQASKLLNLFKRKKEEKANEDSKKIAVANFEINVKTR